MTDSIFRGIATALITPFRNGEVDYDTFGRLIDWQIENGIDALVICGTTGEGSTLSDEEHKACIRFAVERAAGRTVIIAGTGSNDTNYAINLTKYSCDVGADAMLVVTPYYNKATQRGLVESFYAIADASTKPMIVYNVPSRTGCNIQPQTYLKLAEHENIRGIKEANGDISSVVETQSLLRGKLDLSNLMPRQTREICDRFWDGDIAGAAKLQCDYLPLINALFSEVNPIPVKAAMAAMGFGENSLRLPLTCMEQAHAEVLLRLMREQGLIQ